MTDSWVYPLVGLAIVHVIATVLLFHWLGRDEGPEEVPGDSDSNPGASIESEAGIDAETAVVVCPHCGEKNQRGDRYCRRCVADLGSEGSRHFGSGGPDSPLTR
ncbi:MAG: zinc-ribbon domain-containing protein [Halanaeroarchaeum sp.]